MCLCVCVCLLACSLLHQGTLEGLISCYCTEGDIEGATRILDHMKSLNVAVEEKIYAALITGEPSVTDVWSCHYVCMCHR